MLVKAIRMGFYDNIRRREGAVFRLKNRKEFSENWMELVDKKPIEAPKEVEPDDLVEDGSSHDDDHEDGVI